MIKEDRTILKDLLYYVPAKLVPGIAGFFLVIILTHSLTSVEYGQYITILAIINLSNVFISAWLRQSILRFYPDYQMKDNTRNFQDKVLPLVALSILIVSMIVTMAMLAFGYNSKQIILALIVSITQILFSYLITLYQSTRLSKKYILVVLIQSVLQLIFVLIFVFIAHGGYYLALMAFAAGYIGAELYIYIYRKKTDIYFKPSMRHFDWELSRKLLRYGLPMSVWIISFQLLFLANRLIISSMRSNKELGIYASSYDLINGSLSLMMTPFLLASHPIIMQLWAQTHERTEIEQLITRVLRYLLLLCIPIFIFSLVVNEELLAFVLGQGFGIEGWIVPVLVAGVICSGFSMYAHKGLEIAERTKVMLGIAVITVCLNIVLNLIFIKRFGYPAAAIIALFSYLFYMFVAYRFSRRYIRLRFSLKSCFRIAIASGISGVCLWIVKQYTRDALTSSAFSIIMTMLLFGCGYLLILSISGELSTEIKKFLKLINHYRFTQAI